MIVVFSCTVIKVTAICICSAGVGGGDGREAQKQQKKERDKLSHDFLLSEINENDIIIYAGDAPFFVLEEYFSSSRRTVMRSVILP